MKLRDRHLLVDVDGVLAAMDPLLHALNTDSGLKLSLSDWTRYDLASIYGMNNDQMFESFYRHDVIRIAEPLPGARKALALLKREFQLHIVTHRGWHTEGDAQTRDWFARHDLAHDTITVVPFGAKKSDVYRLIAPEFEAFFEDSLSNLDDALSSKLVKRPIVIDHPWNQNCGNRFRMGHARFPSLLHAANELLLKTSTNETECAA